MKQEIKDYKKKILKNHLSAFTRFLYYIGVTGIKLVNTQNKKQFWNYKKRLFNPWHPLSYVIVAVLVPFSILIHGLSAIKEIPQELVRLFKYK